MSKENLQGKSPKNMEYIKSIEKMKIAHKLIFYGMDGCINCAFLMPLLSLADRKNLFNEVEAIHFKDKTEYKEKIPEILEKYNFKYKTLPSPVILIQKKDSGPSYLVKPEIVVECAIELMDSLNMKGDSAVIQYMDGEFDLSVILVNLLIKMSSNLIIPVNT